MCSATEGATREGRAAADLADPRLRYGLACLALTGPGGAAALLAGAPAAEVWAGGLSAWAIQVAAFWPLWGRIRRGERALHVWVAGIAARLAGLGVLVLAAAPAGLEAAPAAVAYGLTIVVLLWVEAWWLARATNDGR